MANTRRLDGQGRIILPSHIRKELKLEKDSEVTIDLLEDGSVRIKPAKTTCALCGEELESEHWWVTIGTPAGQKHVCDTCKAKVEMAEQWKVVEE